MLILKRGLSVVLFLPCFILRLFPLHWAVNDSY